VIACIPHTTTEVPSTCPPPRGNQSRREEALIREILDSRNELFDTLLAPHLSALIRTVRAKMRNDSEFEDIVQQTNLKAFTQLRQFEIVAQFTLSRLQVANQASSPLKECERWERVAPARPLEYGPLPGVYRLRSGTPARRIRLN
jgi:hypothetical protein